MTLSVAASGCGGLTTDAGLQLGYNSNTRYLRYLLARGMQPSLASLLVFIISGLSRMQSQETRSLGPFLFTGKSIFTVGALEQAALRKGCVRVCFSPVD